MALIPGTRLGPYEIAAQIGVGGMGEVYRATDTSLKRQVAIKVLPVSVAGDVDRLARFQREAEVLASLNHPNIAAIYGLEKTSDLTALVMELVEGDNLSQRIARGAIPVDEALPIAKQIAEALEAAHEQGIIHRDLKPANIKVKPDGTVKVLDFGLAKAMESPSAMSPSVSQAPTITTPAMMTGVGMILGTAAYMAPEQARGKAVDKRADIWAFGAVLFEMLSGQRAFPGEDLTDTLAAVVKLDPKWDALGADVPARVERVLHLCLQKDPKQRAQAIGDVRLALDGAFETAGSAAPAPVRSLGKGVLAIGAGVTFTLLVGAVAWLLTRPAVWPVVRTTITTSGSTAIQMSGLGRDIAITPDGSRIAYRGNNQLLVRALDQLEPTVLNGLGAPRDVFISPDGQWVGFFDLPIMKKVAITGGSPVTIVSLTEGTPRGATWGADGSIIFATNAVTTGLQRVSAAGGDPMVLTTPDRTHGERDHLWPEFLPGGTAVLFTITSVEGNTENAQIAVLDLQSGTSKVLIHGGSDAQYVPTGHLIYVVGETLRAVAFDLGRLEVVGTPTSVFENLVSTPQGAANVAVAANGSLVYVSGAGGSQRIVVSIDRQGKVSPLSGVPPDSYRDVRVSPDGGRLALATEEDVWTYDVARATLSRLTTDPAPDNRPLWTPDGHGIVFTSFRAGYPEIFRRTADGTGSDQLLLSGAEHLIDLHANDWSADGQQLLVTEVPGTIQCAIEQIAVGSAAEVKLLVKSEYCNDKAALSPDGRWMAYHSNISGRYEIYIERYPELGERRQVSTGGGRNPVWSRDGRELFFGGLDGGQIFVVPMRSGQMLVTGRQQVSFEFPMLVPGGGNHPFDIGEAYRVRRRPDSLNQATLAWA